MQSRLDADWDEQAGYYRLGDGAVEPMANAMLPLTHAVAAMRGHVGPARNDQRARVLAARRGSSPRRRSSAVPAPARPTRRAG